MEAGAADVLFAGQPVAYELTGGSSGGSKLIPYSAEGLRDFQQAIVPWLARTLANYDIRGKVYFSISPAGREAQFRGGLPVGLPDGAYLGETAGAMLAQMTAVPFSVAGIRDLAAWREQSLDCLRAAEDLELISVWSPTFLLQLLGDVGDTCALWPRLKVISCWASGPSRRYLEPLRSLFPHATIEPKGLLSTEGVVTVPDAEGRPALTPHGFFEFDDGQRLLLADELTPGGEYQVVITTASGLYRYRTGDRVRYEGTNAAGRPVLEFIGRDSLTSRSRRREADGSLRRPMPAGLAGLRSAGSRCPPAGLRAGLRKRVPARRTGPPGRAPGRQSPIRLRPPPRPVGAAARARRTRRLSPFSSGPCTAAACAWVTSSRRACVPKISGCPSSRKPVDEDCPGVPQRAALPPPRRDFRQIAALPAADAHHAGGAGAARTVGYGYALR